MSIGIGVFGVLGYEVNNVWFDNSYYNIV